MRVWKKLDIEGYTEEFLSQTTKCEQFCVVMELNYDFTPLEYHRRSFYPGTYKVYLLNDEGKMLDSIERYCCTAKEGKELFKEMKKQVELFYL